MWSREEDAIRYGLSGEFERLTLRLKDTFSDLYQWNVALSGGDPMAQFLPQPLRSHCPALASSFLSRFCPAKGAASLC